MFKHHLICPKICWESLFPIDTDSRTQAVKLLFPQPRKHRIQGFTFPIDQKESPEFADVSLTVQIFAKTDDSKCGPSLALAAVLSVEDQM